MTERLKHRVAQHLYEVLNLMADTGLTIEELHGADVELVGHLLIQIRVPTKNGTPRIIEIKVSEPTVGGE